LESRKENRKKNSKLNKLLKNRKVMVPSVLAAVLLVGSLAYTGAFESNNRSDGPSAVKDGQAQATKPPSAEEYNKMSDEELVDKVNYYNEISLSKEEVEQKAPQAVNQEAKNQNITVNLENEEYRNFIYSKAMATGKDSSETEEEKNSSSPSQPQGDDVPSQQEKTLIDYAKWVDKYENKLKNQRIRALVQKTKEEGLSKAERVELTNLLPFDLGPTLKPETETNPSEEAPEEEQPPSDQQQEGTPSEEEPNRDNPSGDQEESIKDQVDDLIGDVRPSGEQQEGTNREESPSGDNNRPEEPTDSSDRQDQDPAAENPQSDDTDADSSDTPRPEDEQTQEPDSSDDGSTDEGQPEDANKDGQDEQSEALGTEANGYNRQKAVDYAYQWWNGRNPEYRSYEYDCTNFISQVIHTAGIKERKGNHWDWADYWYYDKEQPSMTWTVAHSFYRHMKIARDAQNASSIDDLKVGDIVSVDFAGDGEVDHSMVITKINNGLVYATYHSNDNKDKLINHWFAQSDVYAWEMETIKN